MSEKTLNTRIGLKIDTLENWNKSTLALKKGEIAFATVAATAGNGLTEPVVMMKIGENGVKTFKDIEWNFYAKASDVLASAKSEEALTTFINNVIADAGIASSEAMEQLAGRVTTVENALNGNENTDGTVAKKIKDAIDALDLENTYVSQEDGKSLIETIKITKLDGITEGANKVEASSVNGNIKIDGVETVVYTQPDITSADITDFNTAVAAIKVNEAVKATQDGNGDVIADTYAKKNDVYTKTEADTTFTTEAEVKTIAATEINTIIGGVSDTDTIENITTLVNYVNEHGADTSALVSEVYGSSETTGTSRIDTLEDEIDTITGTGEGSITKKITDAITAENLAQYAKTADLGTMAKETATDYIKKTEAVGYNDILTKTEAQDAYQAKGEYATAEQGTKADSALQGITTTENGGLKVTNKNQIDIDENIVFVFDCGDSDVTA